MHENIDINDSYEFFFVAMTMLYQRGETNVIPEMMQVITPSQMMQLVQLYGGKQLKLPDPKELSICLKASLFIYKIDFLKQNEARVINELELEGSELNAIRKARDEWYLEMKHKVGAGYLKAVLENA